MKIKPLIVFLIILIAMSTSCVNSQIIGNGNVVKKERALPSFTSVTVRDGLDLTLTQGEEHSAIIEADENLIESIETEVINGVLNIYCTPHIIKGKKRTIHITFKKLTSIKASGGSDIYAKASIKFEKFEVILSGGSDLDRLNLHTNNFVGDFSGGSDANIIFESVKDIKAEASGGSDIELSNVSGETCVLTLSGGSDAIVDGNTKDLTVRAKGGSKIDGYDFIIQNCTLDLSGASDAKLSIIGTLDVTLSGASDVSCIGNPKITNEDVCKSCDFEIK